MSEEALISVKFQTSDDDEISAIIAIEDLCKRFNLDLNQRNRIIKYLMDKWNSQ